MTTTALTNNWKSFGFRGLGTPILVLAMITMMVLPLNPFLLDIFFTFNIALALVVLLACVYCHRPLDFAVFPTVLLVTTLLRLALNVASTRVVLLNGHAGTDAAGQVIKSFGEVVVGGNYTVGFVVFIILVLINFVVVTKGAGRVSEVSARFTLDAMPGKQMAIDADLNAGMLTQDEAKRRRTEVSQEADYYGAMDGASKFVRGDAIAGILILFINIIGGLIIGMVQYDMSFSSAVHNYILLTIGDGLAAQVPSILLSTAAAIMVTRVSSEQDMGDAVVSQLFKNPKALYITAGVLGALGIIPGMPHFVFLSLASVSAIAAYYMTEHFKKSAAIAAAKSKKPVETPAEKAEAKELDWDDVAVVDVIGLEVGYRVIPLVDDLQGGQLLGRIKGVRKKLSQELGFLIPVVHIRDNLDLAPNIYRITLMGVTLAEAEVHLDKHLAINPGQVFGELEGIPGKDPAFGLEAVWINPDKREHAQTLGYTVVDPSIVIATHLSHLLQTYASELLGHEEVQKLLDRLAETAPKLIESLIPDLLPLGSVVKVLQNLLDENIPIRDLRTIAETLAEHALITKETDALTAAVRVALNRLIVQNINGMGDDLPVITLNPELEQLLQSALQMQGNASAALEPGMAERLQASLMELAQRQETLGQPAVLLVQPIFRKILARFAKYGIQNLHVLSYQEIPDNKKITIIGTVG